MVRPDGFEDAGMERLFRQHYLELVRLASLWTENTVEAEDVVQDAFANLELSGVSSPLPFLRTVVANRARSAARRKKSERRAINNLASASPSRVGALEDSLATFDRALMLSIRRLPDRQQDVLILRFYLDWSTERTAQELGISVSAVRSSTHRALQSLKIWMARDTDEH